MKPKVHPTIYQRLLRAFSVTEIEPVIEKENQVNVGDINDVTCERVHDDCDCYAALNLK